MKKILKYLFLTLLLFSLTSICRAQEKFKVGISMGQVFPLSEFKSTNITSTKAGYAQTGFTLNVDGDYFLYNRFSVSLRFLFGNSPINQTEYRKFMKNKLESNFSPNDTIEYNITSWQWVTPLIGCKFNYPVVLNKVYAEAGIFTGINFTQIPNQNLVYNDKENKQLVISQNVENTDVSIPITFNAGFRFCINKSMQFKINAEYFQTKAKYSNITYTKRESADVRTIIENTVCNVPIQTLNASIGLVYNF